MNILVVNDDGIQSAGFRALVDALSEVASVYVCAPKTQQSAKSHSITLGKAIDVREVEYPGAVKAYEVDGTPADCTKIGLQFMEEQGVNIHMVYSGINLGSNLGRDTLYSGTVGAASEAALGGVYGVAVSADSHSATHFGMAQKLAVEVIDKIYGKLDTSVVISINVPDLPEEEIKGVRFAPLGNRFYDDRFHKNEEGKYELSGQPSGLERHPGCCDVREVADNYAVITPLQFDFTCNTTMKEIKEWEF